MRKTTRLTALAVTAALTAAAPAAAFEIQAHRGGPLANGTAVAPENSLTAFKAARGRGAHVIELDTHVSSDRVPFVMHDATLDRTTDCTGNVAERTAAEIDACHIDTLGTGDVMKEAPGATEPVPRLAAALEWAKASGARLNIELNYYPTEPLASTTPNFIADVLDTIDASGVPKSRVLIQSFLPGNLDPAEARGYKTAIITFKAAEPNAISFAKQGGYEVLEPEWPLENARAFVREAHRAGKRVIPFTLNASADIAAAKRAGVDGVITDDPARARIVNCKDERATLQRAFRRLKVAQAAARRAKTAKQKRAAARRVKAAKRGLAKARRAARRACP